MRVHFTQALIFWAEFTPGVASVKSVVLHGGEFGPMWLGAMYQGLIPQGSGCSHLPLASIGVEGAQHLAGLVLAHSQDLICFSD